MKVKLTLDCSRVLYIAVLIHLLYFEFLRECLGFLSFSKDGLDTMKHPLNMNMTRKNHHHTKGMEMNIRATELQKIQLQQRVIQSQIFQHS